MIKFRIFEVHFSKFQVFNNYKKKTFIWLSSSKIHAIIEEYFFVTWWLLKIKDAISQFIINC